MPRRLESSTRRWRSRASFAPSPCRAHLSKWRRWRRAPRQGVERLADPSALRCEDGLSLAWQLCPANEAAIAAAQGLAAAHDLDLRGARSRPGRLSLSRNSAAALTGSLSRTTALYTSPRVPLVLRAEQAAPCSGTTGRRAASDGTTRSPIGLPAAALVLGPLALEQPAPTNGGADPQLQRDEHRTLRATTSHPARAPRPTHPNRSSSSGCTATHCATESERRATHETISRRPRRARRNPQRRAARRATGGALTPPRIEIRR